MLLLGIIELSPEVISLSSNIADLCGESSSGGSSTGSLLPVVIKSSLSFLLLFYRININCARILESYYSGFVNNLCQSLFVF
jgi:hypothetical protein